MSLEHKGTVIKPVWTLDSWLNKTWRPAMGWTYMVTCITDFILFPVLWALMQAQLNVDKIEPWVPLTLQGAGLYHIAMGAVLGVAAWSRGREKISRDRLSFEYDVEPPLDDDEPLPRRNTRRKPREEEDDEI